MERYCYLIGADGKNGHKFYFEDEGTEEFLSGLGAKIYDMAIDAVNELFFSFSKGTRYDQAGESRKPVSRMFCSMNLGRLSIQPFAVYGVCGVQPSGDNELRYMQVYLSPQEDLYGVEFFDRVFGTRYVGKDEIRVIAESGELRLPKPERSTDHVKPMIAEADRAAVCGIVEQIYNKKNVVIRLEQGADFNKRAEELLIGIYALIPPVRRIQTGFAIYKNSDEILNISKEGSVRLFVVPHEESVLGLLDHGFYLYDLESSCGSEVSEGDLFNLLCKWSYVDQAEREETAKSFERELLLEGCNETDLYPLLIEKYFDPKQWWWESNDVRGTIRDLSELVNKHKDTPLLKAGPSINRRFMEKSGSLIAEGRSLSRMILDCIDDPNPANTELLDYCINGIGYHDISIAAVRAYRLLRDEKEQKSMGDMVKKHSAELEELKFVHAAEIEELKKRQAAKIEEIEKQQESEAGALYEKAAIDEEQQNAYRKEAEEIVSRHKAEIEELKTSYTSLSEEQKNSHEAEIRELAERHKQQLEELTNKHNSEISRLKASAAAKAADLPKDLKAKASVSEQDVLDRTLRTARLTVYSKNEKSPVLPAGYKPELKNLKSRLIGLWNKKVMRRSDSGGSDGFGAVSRSVSGIKESEDLRSNYGKLMYELEKTRGSKLYYESRAEKLESDITVLNDKIQMLTKRTRPLKSGRNLFVGTFCGILLSVLIGAALVFFGVIRLDRPAENGLLTQMPPHIGETIETEAGRDLDS